MNWAVATFGAGSATWVAVASVKMPLVALPLCLAAILMWELSYDLGKEAVTRTNMIYNQFEFDGFFSTSLQKNGSALEFDTEVERQIRFKSQTRSIMSSDASSQNTVISSLFATTVELNTIIGRINEVITVINTIPFTSISLIDEFGIPSEPQLVNLEITQDIFNLMSFDVAGNNLILSDVSFEGGFLKLTLTISDDKGVDEFLEASITYTLQDDTNNLNGSFPVKVYNIPRTQEIEIVSGNHQTGVQGTQLSEALIVVVKDREGNVVSGEKVNFKIKEGNGSLSQESTITDANGNAQTKWTLGDNTELQTVEAMLIDDQDNVIDTVFFSATSTDACLDNAPPTLKSLSYTCKKNINDPPNQITSYLYVDFINENENDNFDDHTIVVTDANGGGYDERFIFGNMRSGTFQLALADLLTTLSSCSPTGNSTPVLKQREVYLIDPCGNESNRLTYQFIIHRLDED